MNVEGFKFVFLLFDVNNNDNLSSDFAHLQKYG